MDPCDTAAGRSTQSGEEVLDFGQRDATALELAALRERLRVVEAALDLPARPGRPAPPSLRNLLARVAALERRAGGVGRDPLPGGRTTPPVPGKGEARPAAARPQAWRERGLVLLGGLLTLALCAWLLRPPSSATAPARPTAVATARTTRPLAVAPAHIVAAPSASPATLVWPCEAPGGGLCATGGQGAATPTPFPDETPCPPGGTAPCGTFGAPASAPATPCVGSGDQAAPDEGCADPAAGGRAEPCPLPDERVCMAER